MSKKQDILDAAITIFTAVGTSAASTKSIAIEANVSEALIFKHFKSKDNLIEEIVKSGYREATKLVAEHLEYQTAENYLSNLLDLPKLLVLSNKSFWQMQYKITPLNAMAMMNHQLFMKSSYEFIVKAFAELGYEEPVLEAEIVLFIIDGLWKCIAVNDCETAHIDSLIQLTKQKYNLHQ
ncbi:TetR/AcrR family transcriptional regulator [Flavobacterium granuli]|uniref:TetR family transcriptional regulator n=1 Tax=Flavobacterium granuli TaxID=280093 RepID=A0A1M5S360_9FLAO|nr:TetR/AcrR family transcriptional regulator [Flavobacterium granuli]PRZ21178.1 TetR family transcriptional regulator [Flavobacterium granuli]SHH32403.1 transcriptional regulator, TetR family [Flavobacterium granuli]